MIRTPFTVLMVCMGNICRSPMAERLLVARLEDSLGPVAGELVTVRGAGTSAWHEGEPMDPGAAREVLARGGRATGFAATALATAAVAAADLVLTATIEQVETVTALAGEGSADRAFVLGEFVRFAAAADEAELPVFAPTRDAVAARGRALVAIAASLRAADGRSPRYADQVPDPWGRGEEYFGAVADQIDVAVTALAARLVGPECSASDQ